MQKIINGIKQFQSQVYPNLKADFEQLAQNQSPRHLFITCSDSRIDPQLITQSEPGELFVCRNAGNIVPPHEYDASGMNASIEYAVSVLGVEHIVVCGHSNCGAMKAVLNPASLETLPQVKHWLQHCHDIHVDPRQEKQICPEQELKNVTRQNVVQQLKHLTSHPSIQTKLQRQEIELHGWVYDIETGKIETYDHPTQQFIEL